MLSKNVLTIENHENHTENVKKISMLPLSLKLK
jgi:hypothetical protein